MNNVLRHISYVGFPCMLYCLFFRANLLQAQWVQTNGPYGGYAYCLAVSRNGTGGTNLFAGTGFGVFLSTNDGVSWIERSAGLTHTYVRALAVSPNGSGGTNVFAGTYDGGVFLSTDDGTSWTAVNTGLTNTDITALAFSANGSGGTNLLAGTYGDGVFLSTNNGTDWTRASTGLTNSDIRALAVAAIGQVARMSLPGLTAAVCFVPITTAQTGLLLTRV